VLNKNLLVVLAAAAMCLAIAPIATADEKAVVTTKSLSLDAALELAKAGLASCRKGGFQIAISVIDRGGNLQVTLRDRLAGPVPPAG